VTLAGLIDAVHRTGTLLSPEDLRTSDLAVPHEGSSLAEVRALLTQGT